MWKIEESSMLTSDQEVKESVKEGGGIVLIWGVDGKIDKNVITL